MHAKLPSMQWVKLLIITCMLKWISVDQNDNVLLLTLSIINESSTYTFATLGKYFIIFDLFKNVLKVISLIHDYLGCLSWIAKRWLKESTRSLSLIRKAVKTLTILYQSGSKEWIYYFFCCVRESVHTKCAYEVISAYACRPHECVIKNYFSYLSTKTYVVGTQKNCLVETVLLSTQNKCWNWWVGKYSQFYAEILRLSRPMQHAQFLFVDTLIPSQQFFCHFMTEPVLNSG